MFAHLYKQTNLYAVLPILYILSDRCLVQSAESIPSANNTYHFQVCLNCHVFGFDHLFSELLFGVLFSYLLCTSRPPYYFTVNGTQSCLFTEEALEEHWCWSFQEIYTDLMSERCNCCKRWTHQILKLNVDKNSRTHVMK